MKKLSGADLRSMARGIQMAHGIDLDLIGVELNMLRSSAILGQSSAPDSDNDYRKRLQVEILRRYDVEMNGGDVQPSILIQQSEKDKLDRWIIATENKIEAIEERLKVVENIATKQSVNLRFNHPDGVIVRGFSHFHPNEVEVFKGDMEMKTRGSSIIKDGKVDPHAIGAALTYGRAVHLAMSNITGHELKERINRDFGPGYENDHSAWVTSLYNLLMIRAQDLDIKSKKEGQ